MPQPDQASAAQQAFAIVGPLVGVILGAFIAGLYNLASKQRDYTNDYYKLVVAKRTAAYEQLESLIIDLKTCVLDVDRRPYHLIFSKKDDFETAHVVVAKVMQHALWLSDAAFRKTQELNRLLFRLSESGNAIELGKEKYEAIAELRSELEDILAADMLDLHKVQKFFKSKGKNAGKGIEPVRL